MQKNKQSYRRKKRFQCVISVIFIFQLTQSFQQSTDFLNIKKIALFRQQILPRLLLPSGFTNKEVSLIQKLSRMQSDHTVSVTTASSFPTGTFQFHSLHRSTIPPVDAGVIPVTAFVYI